MKSHCYPNIISFSLTLCFTGSSGNKSVKIKQIQESSKFWGKSSKLIFLYQKINRTSSLRFRRNWNLNARKCQTGLKMSWQNQKDIVFNKKRGATHGEKALEKTWKKNIANEGEEQNNSQIERTV